MKLSFLYIVFDVFFFRKNPGYTARSRFNLAPRHILSQLGQGVFLKMSSSSQNFKVETYTTY